jgi:hypothetical protein
LAPGLITSRWIYWLVGAAAVAALPAWSGLEADLLNGLIFANFAWMGLSFFWADNKRQSLRRLAVGGAIASTAIILASAYSLQERAALIAFCTGLPTLVYVIDAVRTSQFLDPTSGRFGGVEADRHASKATVFIFSVVYLQEVNLLPTVPGQVLVAAVLYVLFMTRSRGSVWSGFIAGLAWLAMSLVRDPEDPPWAVIYMLGLYAVIGLGVSKIPRKGGSFVRHKSRVVSLIHMRRDPNDVQTLTLRLPVWRFVLNSFGGLTRWLVGFGYGSFWIPQRSAVAAHWKPETSHSMYVEPLADTGIIGLGLFCALLASAFVTAFGTSAPHGPFILATLVAGSIRGIVQVAFLRRDFQTFVFLVLITDLSNLDFTNHYFP